MLNRIRAYYESGDALTLTVRKNVVHSFLIKVVSIALNLVLVPLLLGLLTKELYGIWLTLSSIVTWFTFIDFGLGNGLRNKLTELLIQGDQKMAQVYVSTLYKTTTLIALAFWFLYSCIHPWINWASILRVPVRWQAEVSTLAYLAFSVFWLQLVLKNISFVLLAVQRSAANSLFPLLSNLLTLLIAVLFRPYLTGSILNVGLALLAPQVLVLIGFQLYFFRNELAYLRPRWPRSDFVTLRHFGNLGLSFFIIQIMGVVIFTTANLLITQLLGPSYVAEYDIAYKYFGLLPVAFGLLMAPLWSAFGHAYYTRNVDWIRKTLKQMRQVWLVVALGQCVLFMVADHLIPLWVGRSIAISAELALTMVVYYGLYMYGSIYVNLLNGVGKVRYQMLISMASAFLMVPLAYGLVRFAHLGLAGIQLALIICSLYGSVIAPVEVNRLLRRMDNQSDESLNKVDTFVV